MSPMVTCPKCGAATDAGAAFCQNCGGALAGAAAAPAGARPAAAVHYGGFWIRFLAAFIDGIIIEAVVIPVSFVLGAMVGAAGSAAGGANQMAMQMTAAMLGACVGIFANVLYFTFLESSSKQATLGKMILGLKVTDHSYQRISVGRALGRTLSKYISALILLIGYIMAGFTDRKQALHDMIAGTYVIYAR